MKAFLLFTRPSFRALLLLTTGSLAGYLASLAGVLPGTGIDPAIANTTYITTARPPATARPGARSLAAQEALVEEKRRQFHAVVPDVASIEARIARLTEIIRGMSRRDLTENELIRIAQSLEGPGWMKETLTSYRDAQKNHDRLSAAGLGRAHPEILALISQSDALAGELSQAIAAVFNHQRRLLERQEKDLEAARQKVAAAVKAPATFQHLLLAVTEAERELQRLREIQTTRLLGSIR